jgi:hypothetical protein
MERMSKPNGEPTEKRIADLQVLSAVVGRMMLAQQMGLQYNGARDIYQALGYKDPLVYNDYYQRYLRQDIAKAIIDRPVKSTWQGPLQLIESTKADETEFEKAWIQLNKELGIKTKFSQVDKLTGIGRYGLLLLGLDDVRTTEDFMKPVSSGKRQLLYLRAFGENTAIPTGIEFEDDPNNIRYGLPRIYTLQIVDVATQKNTVVRVHYTRVIHILDDPLESEVFGTPRLEAVFNRLYDLEKIIGGDAEMFWRGARPGYSGKLDPDYTMTAAAKEALKDQVDEYENDLRRILINEGIDLKALAQQIADPSNHVDVAIQMISAVTGIPKRILTGSERGELASTQDTSEWKEYVQARREDHAEPHIIRLFVNRMIELKILPKPSEDYTVRWSELYSQSEKSKVEIGKGRATALREYTSNPIAMEVMPPKAFNEFCMGFDPEQVTLIEEMRNEAITEEELNQAIIDAVNPPEPVVKVGKPAGEKVPFKKGETKIPA